MKVISVENVSKKFILAHDRPRNLADAARGMFQRKQREDFWALKDVSFEVEQGEALGIIGDNGAGKSTMLKLLTRIMDPTKGRIRTRGRVSALIEVGAGFHPEMTGRENVYLNGSIIGMTQREINSKFDEIVAFAELEKFIDTPVKRYSSGMYARLGFAVAAHVDPEILICDEVLSVGDGLFQKKCIKKMTSVRETEGATILFVSHNMIAVQNLCSRAICLKKGAMVEDGPARDVVNRYLGMTADAVIERVWEDAMSAPGNDEVRLHRVRVYPEHGSPADPITTEAPVALEFDYWNLASDNHLSLSIHLFNEDGVRVFETASSNDSVWRGRPFPAGLFRSVCHIPANLLNDGAVRVQLMVVKDRAAVTYSMDSILVFDVIDAADRRGGYLGKWEGAVRPILEWKTDVLSPILDVENEERLPVEKGG